VSWVRRSGSTVCGSLVCLWTLASAILCPAVDAAAVDAAATSRESKEVSPPEEPVTNYHSCQACGEFQSLEKFYIQVDGRCVEWSVRDGYARHRRKGPLGDVLLEMSMTWYRRIGPVELLLDHLQEMECGECVLSTDYGHPHYYPGVPGSHLCSSALSAYWYRSKTECARSLRWPALPDTGQLVQHCVTSELTREGIRRADRRDVTAYSAAAQKLAVATKEVRQRNKALAMRLSRLRKVYERREQGCVEWNLRQDPGKASGWLSRTEEDVVRKPVRFHFAAHVRSFKLDRPIYGVVRDPSHPGGTVGFGYWGGRCKNTILKTVNETEATFQNQVWFFSKPTCEDAPYGDLARGFGPGC
jgi:hypothetical protein